MHTMKCKSYHPVCNMSNFLMGVHHAPSFSPVIISTCCLVISHHIHKCHGLPILLPQHKSSKRLFPRNLGRYQKSFSNVIHHKIGPGTLLRNGSAGRSAGRLASSTSPGIRDTWDLGGRKSSWPCEDGKHGKHGWIHSNDSHMMEMNDRRYLETLEICDKFMISSYYIHL